MPGSSLWLVPSPDSPLSQSLTTLIHSTIPSLYPIAIPPRFSPHVTLTADTVPDDLISREAQQEWLDHLSLPDSVGDLEVAIKEAQVGEIFFRKLTLRVEKTAALSELAVAAAMAGTDMRGERTPREQAEKVVREVYAPHLSLMYSDLPQGEINARLTEVKAALQKAKDINPDALTASGAEIWLVPTFKDIEDWQPIARRKLESVRWSWET